MATGPLFRGLSIHASKDPRNRIYAPADRVRRGSGRLSASEALSWRRRGLRRDRPKRSSARPTRPVSSTTWISCAASRSSAHSPDCARIWATTCCS